MFFIRDELKVNMYCRVELYCGYVIVKINILKNDI